MYLKTKEQFVCSARCEDASRKKKKKKRHWLKNEKKQKGQKKVPDGKTEMRGNVHDWLRLSHSYTHAHTHTHTQTAAEDVPA